MMPSNLTKSLAIQNTSIHWLIVRYPLIISSVSLMVSLFLQTSGVLYLYKLERLKFIEALLKLSLGMQHEVVGGRNV